MIILVYTIPNLYVFIRIGQFCIRKGYRLYYALVYILLASVYPVVNVINDRESGFYNIMASASNYLLPFFLYLFLFILIFDILLLINLLLRIIPRDRIRNSVFRRNCLAIILFLSISVVVAGVINFNTIRTSEYSIRIPGRTAGIRHLRIAFTADFHLTEKTNIHFVEKFARRVDEIKPDILIFGGDIVEGSHGKDDMIDCEAILKNIRTRYGVFAVLGNHEYYSGHDKGIFFKKSGMKLLCDSVAILENSFSVAGRYDSHTDSRKTVDDLIRSAPDSLPLILVDHRPTEIDLVSKTKVDIQLSGHTHNGQLFPINLITQKVYRLSWGYLKIAETNFFVTSGIRLWGPPVRTTGKSEIMVINVTFTQ
jgi:hypothetical protein